MDWFWPLPLSIIKFGNLFLLPIRILLPCLPSKTKSVCISDKIGLPVKGDTICAIVSSGSSSSTLNSFTNLFCFIEYGYELDDIISVLYSHIVIY